MQHMMKIQTILIAALLLLLPVSAYAAQNDLELLRQRVKSGLVESFSYDASPSYVKGLMDRIDEEGKWPDINYTDLSRTGFNNVSHLENICSMALAYERPGTELSHDSGLMSKLHLALGFWLRNDFQCENWWWNQIGVPRIFINLLYILDDDVPSDQRDQMVEIAKRANMDCPGARPGGDRLFIASLYTRSVLWERNEPEVRTILHLIESEFCYGDELKTTKNPEYFTAGPGLERDMSFHHRSDCVDNTPTYGHSCAMSYLQCARLVSGTAYEFGEGPTRLLIDYYLDGICRHRVNFRTNDPNIANREMTRKAGKELKYDSKVARSLMSLSDWRKDELETVARICEGDDSLIPSYAKFFWRTEYFVFQRPHFFTSVRMFSSRNANMECPYNGEGLFNHFRGDGTNYISRRGDEYADIAPVYDYRKIPGATVMQLDTMPAEDVLQYRGVTEFVGAVTDGLHGAVADDFVGGIEDVKVRKSWFFFDDFYVCLGAGLQSSGDADVCTTLNQCYLRGDVTVSTGKSDAHVAETGDHQYDRIFWAHHDDVGYVILDKKAHVGMFNKSVEGNWRRVSHNRVAPDEKVTEDVFALWINHGPFVKDGVYAYAVMPDADIAATESFSKKPRVRIISNTAELQAVDGGDLLYTVFYEPGKVKLRGGLTVATDKPAIVQINRKDNTLWVSDPTRKQSELTLTVNGRQLRVALPEGAYAGKSTDALSF